MQAMTAADAAALVRPADTLGMPLGPGQPVGFLEALGERDDWTDLKVYGAFLAVFTKLFEHPNVHYLSGFFGPLERAIRAAGGNLGFAPADFRRFGPLLDQLRPRVLCTSAAPPDADGWCSLSLHAGSTVDPLHEAGADPERLLVVEVSPKFPRTVGLLPDHRHAIHVDEIDVLVETDKAPLSLDDPEPSDVDRAIAEHVRAFIHDGTTVQTGIGAIPSMVMGLLADGPGGDYGIHSEMFTNGLMRLHRSGKVTNRKGIFDGVSITTFAAGSTELYEWLDGNTEVAFLPVEIVNSVELIAKNRELVTINAALAIDVHGQVVADTLDGAQYSGIGGHEDFVAGAGLTLEARSLLCLPSTVTVGGQVRSRLVPFFGPGAAW
jgi:acyl-CoA hydrolase